MKTSTRLSHLFLAVLALSAFMLNSLPGMESCQTESSHGADEAIEEAHCLCAHSMEEAQIPLSLAAGVADCGTGCACIPARTQWQGQLSSRIQSEQRVKEMPDFSALSGPPDGPSDALWILERRVPVTTDAPPLNPVLESLRTVIILT